MGQSGLYLMVKKRSVSRASFKPGHQVPESGLYCVEHHAHRLMHMITLGANIRFPRCKRCGDSVRFTLLRKVKEGRTVPFRSTAILEEYPERPGYWRKAS
jgi:hypothetical protein